MAGECLLALSSRALYWPSREVLFVADLHLGKAAAFRARSLPLPHGTTSASLARLDVVLGETGARHVVVLGDLWHDKLGRSQDLLERLGEWTRSKPEVQFTLITGNHDLKAGKTPASSRFHEVEELCLEPFCCLHHPQSRQGMYVLCGHLHPGMQVGAARSHLKLPCFWFGPEVGILPAFGEFTGLAPIEPRAGDQIFVVADDKIVSLKGAALASRAARQVQLG